MILKTDLLCVIVVIFQITNALPYRRFRRQINVQPVSGSIVGTAYYGIGADPNFGSFIAQPDTANSGIIPISYNPDSSLFNTLINPNFNNIPPPQQQQQQQQNYMYNNYNPNYAWQSSNNNYNNPFYNRYPPGSQGWYATGGNYWYNKGQSITAHPWLLLFTSIIIAFVNKK